MGLTTVQRYCAACDYFLDPGTSFPGCTDYSDASHKSVAGVLYTN